MGTELLFFLQEWLFDHIQKVDKQYSKRFQKILGGGVLGKLF
ncbi:hypothetical protein [Solemya pervernicosa gill symbiont]|nr:hypothetical protein [Solemya pervernicosa gill symbiont]